MTGDARGGGKLPETMSRTLTRRHLSNNAVTKRQRMEARG